MGNGAAAGVGGSRAVGRDGEGAVEQFGGVRVLGEEPGEFGAYVLGSA
ncbi:hypothetical protein ABT010_02055 [Streptomyces sp. NPDC002668]